MLLFSAARLFLRQREPDEVSPPAFAVAVATGLVIGFLSGLTGTGGGIFLTPLLLFCGWARTRQAAAASALFILVNSAAGLFGYVQSGKSLSMVAWWLSVAAVGGGSLGSYLGSARFPVRTIQLLLAAVLLIAGGKLIFSR